MVTKIQIESLALNMIKFDLSLFLFFKNDTAYSYHTQKVPNIRPPQWHQGIIFVKYHVLEFLALSKNDNKTIFLLWYKQT